MAKLTIEVPADDLEKALQSAYMKQKNKINMPGFRKGKVPRQMIEKMYGPEIFYDDAANSLIPKAYSEAYDQCELEIVSQPEINVEQIEKGKKSVSYSISMRSHDGTLTDEQADKAMKKVLEALKAIGAELRM